MGTQHALELSSINYSLFTLGRCIAALTAKNGAAHVPYRDSKLTRYVDQTLWAEVLLSCRHDWVVVPGIRSTVTQRWV
jgi:hypothetical protein